MIGLWLFQTWLRPQPAVPPSRAFLASLCILFNALVAHAASDGRVCAPVSVATQPSETGFAKIHDQDGASRSIYWIKLKSRSQPAHGTLFYLAGGPTAHFVYTDMAESFHNLAYPNFDVVLYDYYGINCSSAIQDLKGLKQNYRHFTMPAMARDFIELKHTLIGYQQKAFIMGGSHGSMLGAEIVRDFPDEVEKAILFSGATKTGWFQQGWFRFDELLQKLAAKQTGLASTLDQLLTNSEKGQLVIQTNSKFVALTRDQVEVILWLVFSQDSAAQANLEDLLQATLAGDTTWLAQAYQGYLSLLNPVEIQPTPTDQTEVTRFHQCNIWFPRSTRTLPEGFKEQGRFLNYSSFKNYWDQACKNYDSLGEFPFDATPTYKTDVPILFWVGDQDYFDPAVTQMQWSELTSQLNFHLMPGWSHDFGPNANQGFSTLVQMIKSFSL